MDVGQEIEEKLERVLRLINDAGLAGMLIGAQHNFAWLTAGGRNGIDLSREAGAGTLLVRRDGKRFLLANKIEMPRLITEELAGQGYEPVEFGWEDEKANPTLVIDRARSLLTDDRPIGADLPVGDSVIMAEPKLALVRYRLTDSEIDRYRSLARDAGEVIGQVARGLTPGLSEREIARRANAALAGVGAHPVVTLVAADDRMKRFRHPVPTDLNWRKSVMIVVCARRGGLIVSLSRIVSAGDVPEELARRTRLTAVVNSRLLAATVPGATSQELFAVAARAYREVGFAGEERLHHQGGATGYRTRDWVIHPQGTEKVSDCQAFAWNPSITGTKVEETCLRLNEHVEIISATPSWPSITAEAAGKQYQLPGILSL